VVTATIGARLWARIVDTVIVFVPLSFVFAVVIPSVQGRAVADLPWAVRALPAVVAIAVEAVQLGRGSTTIGKRMHTLLVVRADDGGPLGWGRAVVRAAASPVIAFGSSLIVGGWALVVGVAVLAVAFGDERRRTGIDRIAGTAVVADLRPQGVDDAGLSEGDA
jgi:uncharacterized RDD family membrane protein YckC